MSRRDDVTACRPVRRAPEIVTISSMNNPEIRRLRRLRLRRERDQTGLFFVEGIRFVLAAVERGVEIETLVVAGESEISTPVRAGIRDLLRNHSRQLCVTQEVLQFLSDRDETQGIGAVLRQRWERLTDIRPDTLSAWVALDGIQYPGNLGSILRVAEAAGCDGVMLVGKSADPYDPISVRASMGAVFFQRLVRCEFEEFAVWTRRHGISVIGASPRGNVDYREASFRPPAVLYMGSERTGLPEQRQAACNHTVRIPMAGRCDSLNVATATGILLYEFIGQSGPTACETHQVRGEGQ